MVAFYRAIRQECGYKGPMVFWDIWTNANASDPKSFTHHPIFDDKLGFGGTGDSKDSYRIKNGPFAGCEFFASHHQVEKLTIQHDFQ